MPFAVRRDHLPQDRPPVDARRLRRQDRAEGRQGRDGGLGLQEGLGLPAERRRSRKAASEGLMFSLSSPSPRSCGERAGVRGKTLRDSRKQLPENLLARIASDDAIRPRKRGEVKKAALIPRATRSVASSDDGARHDPNAEPHTAWPSSRSNTHIRRPVPDRSCQRGLAVPGGLGAVDHLRRHPHRESSPMARSTCWAPMSPFTLAERLPATRSASGAASSSRLLVVAVARRADRDGAAAPDLSGAGAVPVARHLRRRR